MNAQATYSPDTGGMIYVVDDDDAVRDGVSLLLRAFGWPVESFPSASDFLARYVPRDGQCLVLDLHMPGMHGAQLEEHLRDQGDEIPVIIVTAYREDPLLTRARAAGASRVLSKPFNDMELIENIEEALASRR